MVFIILMNQKQKNGYPWLYELNKCKVKGFNNGLYELELSRNSKNNDFELRRIIFGNLNLESLPVYKADDLKNSFWTIHRFGYGARPTVMNSNPNFRLPHERSRPVHYAYLLAGKDQNPGQANKYICPESFGVERAIFTWDDISKTRLTIDLISFERILPVWQGTVIFPTGFFV